MRRWLCQFMILVITPVLVSSQSPEPNTAGGDSQAHQQDRHVVITGCLTRNPHGDYELVDQTGVHNLVYKSERVALDSYVGQSITLLGERSAIPSTDTGTARPMPHFKVLKLRHASGKCNN